MPVVPTERKKSRTGATNSSIEERITLRASLSCWRIIWRVDFTTTALSCLEPMTAPTPERAARRPWSLQIPAIKERFSPPGPIRATEAFLPCFSLNIFSAVMASMPQYSEASSMETFSSSMKM